MCAHSKLLQPWRAKRALPRSVLYVVLRNLRKTRQNCLLNVDTSPSKLKTVERTQVRQYNVRGSRLKQDVWRHTTRKVKYTMVFVLRFYH